ncbi:MAG TPA: glycine cleavage system protein GcvH [Armatimonadota bacterium]|jgi:glycine cleavage system H protein
MNPDNLKYTETHQWVRVEGNVAVVGITSYAQEQLGEIVYLDLPQVGDDVTTGEVMGSVESVKSISDVYTPISGKVVEVNEPLMDEPGKINADPYGDAWMVKVEMANPAEAEGLLSAADYQAKLD